MTSLRPLWTGFQYFQHQVDGIRWMMEKEEIGTDVWNRKETDLVTVYGGLQCDEMGLGKTIQIVATIVNHPLKLTLLLAPLAMVETWSQVCRRAGLRVYQPVSGAWECVNPQDPVPEWCEEEEVHPIVYITNFEKLYTTSRLFKGSTFDRVVLDEAHKIRNGDGQMAKEARRLNASIRWAVTGTPLVNSMKDVVSLLAFVGVPYSPLWRWESRLEEAFAELTLHRSLESLRPVLKDAPPHPVIHSMRLPFTTEKEKEFYFAIQGMAMAEAKKWESEVIPPQNAFLLLLRLRQISVHPQIYINAKRRQVKNYVRRDWKEPSTKLLAVRDIIKKDKKMIEADGHIHKYLIFCQFQDEMSILYDYLDSLDLFKQENILTYDGSLTQEKRNAVLEHSKAATEPTVLLLQLQAGGVGLNLQEYDRIIFVSPWWTAALMDQAIARAVRMGQRRTVHVYHLQLEAEDSDENAILIDKLIQDKAHEKRIMLEGLFAMCDNDDTSETEDADQEDKEEEEDEEEVEEPGQENN
jgi:SNF2 family DNA or RNA helicase